MRRLARKLLGLGGLGVGTAVTWRDSSVYLLAIQECRAVQGTLRRLSPSGDFGQPMISPCGTRVAYWGTVNAGDTPRVWMSRVEGAAGPTCVSRGEGIQGHPFWHPDGRRLVHFASKARAWNPRKQFSLDRPPSNLWWLDVNTGQSSRLTYGPFIDERPAVAPDGQSVVFVSNRSGRLNLWRVNLDGTGLEQLTHGMGPDYRPCISHDGRLLAYFSADADGSHQIRLLRLATGENVGCDWTRRFAWSHGPFWYPNDRFLLMHALERGMPAPALWRVDLVTDDVQRVETPGLSSASHGTVDNAETCLVCDSRASVSVAAVQPAG